MKILCLFITYPSNPDNHTMFKNLTKKLVDYDNEVYVITLQERKYNLSTTFKMEDSVNVLRVKSLNFFDSNILEKGLTMMSIGFLYKNVIKKYLNKIKFDAIIYSSPPITYNSIIRYIKNKYPLKSYLILRDIFPDNSKDIGLMKDGLLYKHFRKKEIELYCLSDNIGCMSQGNIDYLLSNNEIDKNKVHILQNWSSDSKNIDKRHDLRSKYGYKKKDFIIVFGGNMGRSQGLEFILDAAKHIKNKDIKFVFIGRGINKNKLLKRKNSEKIENVRIMDYMPEEDYEAFIKESDVGLVSLDKKCKIPNIPSKTTDYFKAGLPIIACIDKNTDYGKILENEAKAGIYSIHGNIENFLNNIEYFYRKPKVRNKMGKNGRKYYEKFLTCDIAVKTILEKIN
jgi:glycosyltransferase involved in cell wall biosynthesis